MSNGEVPALYLEGVGYMSRRPRSHSSRGARRFRIVFVNSGESCADVMKREYGLWHHRYYDDPEMTQYGLTKARERAGEEGSYFRRFFGDRPYFVCSSSLVRAQETAAALAGGDARVFVLPYVDEGAAMDETRRLRSLPGYAEIAGLLDTSFYEPGVGSPEKFMAWLRRADVWEAFRALADGGAVGAEAAGGLGSAPVLFDYMQGGGSQTGGAYTAPVGDASEINLFIVTHPKFMDQFLRKLWRPPFVEFGPLDELQAFVEDGRLTYATTFQQRETASERSACDENEHGGRCRKRVCKTVRRGRRRVRTAGGDRQCNAVRGLLNNAEVATYREDILPVARILRERPDRAGFTETAQRLERLYRPGWFTTRSNRRLPEDMESAMVTCRIGATAAARSMEPGGRRYGTMRRGDARRATRSKTQRGGCSCVRLPPKPLTRRH